MRMVLIPRWLEDVLTSTNTPLTAVLDIVELSNILSKDDVAFYIYVNNNLPYKLFEKLAHSVNFNYLWPSADQGKPEIVDLMAVLSRRLDQLTMIHPEVPLYSGVQLLPIVEEEGKADTEDNYAFECFSLTEDTLGLRVRRINEGEDPVQARLDSYNTFFNLYTHFVTFEVLAASEAFKEFVSLL